MNDLDRASALSGKILDAIKGQDKAIVFAALGTVQAGLLVNYCPHTDEHDRDTLTKINDVSLTLASALRDDMGLRPPIKQNDSPWGRVR
jgi:hypothetical protein